MQPASASSRWCSGEYGSITPSSGAPGATSDATGAPGRRGASTIGRSHSGQQLDVFVAELHERRAASCTVRAHQRERLVLAVLAGPQPRHRGLVVGPAGQVEAADPLDRNDRALPQRPRRRLHGQPRESARTPGTRSAARGTGDRSGRRTRAWHSGHITNAAIVVYGRSYGIPRTIVNRGPQFVQLMNGYL